MDANKRSDMDSKWKQVATRAVTEEKFKAQLKADPVAVMSELGLTPPEGTKIRQDTTKAFKLLPPSSVTDEVKEEIKWWNLRLDTINQFCTGKKKKDAPVAPLTEDGV